MVLPLSTISDLEDTVKKEEQAGLLASGSAYRLRLPKAGRTTEVPVRFLSGLMQLSSPVTAASPQWHSTIFPIFPVLITGIAFYLRGI
jgi:hypothetical protein